MLLVQAFLVLALAVTCLSARQTFQKIVAGKAWGAWALCHVGLCHDGCLRDEKGGARVRRRHAVFWGEDIYTYIRVRIIGE